MLRLALALALALTLTVARALTAALARARLLLVRARESVACCLVFHSRTTFGASFPEHSCKCAAVPLRPLSGWRESDPRLNLGGVARFHYATPALAVRERFGRSVIEYTQTISHVAVTAESSAWSRN